MRFHHKFVPDSSQCIASFEKSHKENNLCDDIISLFFFNRNFIDMCVYVYVENKRCVLTTHTRTDMLRKDRHAFTTGSKWLISVLSDNTQCSNKVNGSGNDDWHLLAHQLDRTNLTKAYTSRRQRSPSFSALADTDPARHWNDPPRGWKDCNRSPLEPTLPSSRSSTDRFRQSKIRPITTSRLRRSPLRYRLCLLVWSTFSSR